MKNVLLTGGLGFIGSHTAVLCLEAGWNVIIIDNCSNSDPSVLDKIESITKKRPLFYKGSIHDSNTLGEIFQNHSIDAVIHFAAFKSVNESVMDPLKYFYNNVSGSINLLHVMNMYSINKIIFSSSATVYDSNENPPFKENTKKGAVHAYGQSKIMVESILEHSEQGLTSVALRYFNPVGAHPSGLIGESPKDIPNNLFPIINQVVTMKRDHLDIFGSDYPTKDGTPERDYIHVMDVARAHLMTLDRIDSLTGFNAINIGTGKSTSVLEIVQAYEKLNNVEIPKRFVSRREGDSAISVADVVLAKELLSFNSIYELEDMVRDSYIFVINN